jgi:hypothetical protein
MSLVSDYIDVCFLIFSQKLEFSKFLEEEFYRGFSIIPYLPEREIYN